MAITWGVRGRGMAITCHGGMRGRGMGVTWGVRWGGYHMGSDG